MFTLKPEIDSVMHLQKAISSNGIGAAATVAYPVIFTSVPTYGNNP